MSTSVNSLTSNFFPEAENGFTTTTAGSVSSGATTVTLNSVSGYTNGEPVVLVIDPTDTSKKQTFTGIVDTSGVQVTSVVWTAGTNQTHALGATVVDYATATHISMISKGIRQQHNQDGTHGAVTATSVTSTNATLTNATITNLTVGSQAPSADWTAIGTAPNTVTANGNRSYSLVFNTVDYTNILNPGTRLRTTRTVAAPTQSTSLNGTTQYWVKTSPNKLTFTDDFVVSAWVKLSSYANASIVSRYNGTSGWDLKIDASGRPTLEAFNAGAANFSYVNSYQSIPLNKWVHIAAQLDMSTFTASTTTSYVMIDGVDVPSVVTRGGTNPTALVQAGNLEIGSWNGGLQPFPGKIAQAAIFNAKVTQATMLTYISQGLSGSETSLASAYSFNGVTTDLNATTPNDLSAGAGSPTATNADSPFGTQASGLISSTLDYGIVQSATFSTNTTVVVQVPEGCTIPTTGGVSAISYSGVKAPYGYPSGKDKWTVQVLANAGYQAANNAGNIYLNHSITVPIGAWVLGYRVHMTQSLAVSGTSNASYALATTSGTAPETTSRLTSLATLVNIQEYYPQLAAFDDVRLTSATVYYMNARAIGSNFTAQGLRISTPSYIYAENAYL